MEEMNCDPLSDSTAFGGPKVVIHFSVALTTESAVTSFTATSMQYRVNLRCIETMHRLSECELGSGPTISTKSCSKGMVATNNFIFPLLYLFATPGYMCWQVLQHLQHNFMWCLILGHQYFLLLIVL